MATKTIEFLGTGRRKTAIARVRLATGSGKITVNGRAFDVYFPLETLRSTVSQPLTVTGTADKLDVRVNVTGGGPNRQAGASRHGISRALLKFDANLPPALKAECFFARRPPGGPGGGAPPGYSPRAAELRRQLAPRAERGSLPHARPARPRAQKIRP